MSLRRRLSQKPVIGVALDYEDGFQVPRHHNEFVQLLYTLRGLLVVDTQEGSWTVSAGQGVWIPAMKDHSIQTFGRAQMRTVYLRPDWLAPPPEVSRGVAVNSLLRELILEVVSWSAPYLKETEKRLASVLVDQIAAAPAAGLYLPSGSDPRLSRVMQALIAEPGDERFLAAWARHGETSPRTLARLFKRETAMTFGQWRRRLRLQRALQGLARGASVKQVALEVGYDSVSAFISMFKEYLGMTPGELA